VTLKKYQFTAAGGM